MMTTSNLLTTPEVAAYLNVPVKTLAYWRSIGKGPAFRRIGRHIRYTSADVEAWVDAQSSTTRGKH